MHFYIYNLWFFSANTIFLSGVTFSCWYFFVDIVFTIATMPTTFCSSGFSYQASIFAIRDNNTFSLLMQFFINDFFY